MGSPGSADAAFKAGYRRFKWHDAERNRPVWADVWFPTTDASDEGVMLYGLGHGKAIPTAAVATGGAPFPLVVMSHGAAGSAPNYAWLAEYLARHGVIGLGVSHYGESWLYGPDTIEPIAITRLWLRPGDCTFALTRLLADEDFRARVDATRIGAIGHSSGGATAIMLGGATLDPAALSAYYQSAAAQSDRGRRYGRQDTTPPPAPAEATWSYRDPRFVSIVALDPAIGPGFSAASLAEVQAPVLVVGSENNDFLPFEHHAAHYAALLPNASLVTLREGEGHFVYLNVCTSDIAVNGVRLCVDRDGVDREAVHARLAPRILAFLDAAMPSEA